MRTSHKNSCVVRRAKVVNQNPAVLMAAAEEQALVVEEDLEGGRAPTTIGKCPIFSIYCFYLPKWSTFRAQINVQIKLVLRRHCKIRPWIIKDKPGQ